jgi:hypothetical protein
MKAPQQTESHQPTPEQLLTLLDLQISSERAKRTQRPKFRAGILIGGIMMIIVIAGVALIVAQGMISDLSQRGEMPASQNSAEAP